MKAVVLAALALAAPPAASIKVDRAQLTARLGSDFAVRTTIAAGAATRRVAHLNVLSLRPGTYVDPEDWSSHRTRYLSGGAATIAWRLKAVNWGSFAVYVAVLSRDGKRLLAVSPPVRVDVPRRQTLSASGILPLVFGLPALLAALWLGLRLRRRSVQAAFRRAPPA